MGWVGKCLLSGSDECPDPDTNVDSVMVTGDTRVNFLCPGPPVGFDSFGTNSKHNTFFIISMCNLNIIY